MKTAVFITPETLLRQLQDESPAMDESNKVFRIAKRAVQSIQRLRDAGFMIIGIGNESTFHGFANKASCDQFLSASSLDDVVILNQARQQTSALITAAGKWLLDLDRSFYISHEEADMDDVEATGCKPFHLSNTDDDGDPNAELATTVDQILELNTEPVHVLV